MAAASRAPPLFGLRVEFSPGNKDKSHQGWRRLYSHRLIHFKYLPFPPCKEDSSTHASSICRRKQPLTPCTRHVSETEGMFWGSPFNNHVIVAAATVASWFPTPTPLREARVAKVPERELKKACKERENPSATSLNLTGDTLLTHTHTHIPSPAQCPRTDNAGNRRWHSRGSLEAETHSGRWIWNVGLVKPRKTTLTCMWSSRTDFKSSDYGVSSGFSFAPLSSPLNRSMVCNILPALCASVSFRGQHDTSVRLHHGVRNWEMFPANIWKTPKPGIGDYEQKTPTQPTCRSFTGNTSGFLAASAVRALIGSFVNHNK